MARLTAEKTVNALSALAHEHRLALFRMLVQKGEGGMSAGVLAEKLGVPPSSLTFHMQQLSHAGLVSQRRDGRHIIYAADYQTMSSLLGYLTENCCAGADCAPKTKAAKCC